MTNTSLLPIETPERLLRRPEVRARVGNPSAETLWRWIRAGEFPFPVKLNPAGTILAWRETEINAWIEARERGEGRSPAAALEGRARKLALKRSTRTPPVRLERRAP